MVTKETSGYVLGALLIQINLPRQRGLIRYHPSQVTASSLKTCDLETGEKPAALHPVRVNKAGAQVLRVAFASHFLIH